MLPTACGMAMDGACTRSICLQCIIAVVGVPIGTLGDTRLEVVHVEVWIISAMMHQAL